MAQDLLISISEIERRTGVSSTRIRQWEQRLGWPASVRSPRGHRRYPASIIPDIREAQRRIDCGRSMRDEIVNGQPVWIHQVVVRQRRRDLRNIDTLPIPRTDAGLRLRSSLVDALSRYDEAGVAAAVAQLPMIRPDDREAAALGILRQLDHPAARAMAAATPTVPATPDPRPATGTAPPDSSEPEAQGVDPDPLPAHQPSLTAEISEPAPLVTIPTPDMVPDPRRHDDAAPTPRRTRPRSTPSPRSTQRGVVRRRTAPAPVRATAGRWRHLQAMLHQATLLLLDPIASAIHHGSARQRTIVAALLVHLQRQKGARRGKRISSRRHPPAA